MFVRPEVVSPVSGIVSPVSGVFCPFLGSFSGFWDHFPPLGFFGRLQLGVCGSGLKFGVSGKPYLVKRPLTKQYSSL